VAEKAYQLIVEHGPDIGKIFPLQREKVIIGRDPVADIVLVDPEVSRQHARLIRGESGYHIEDLHSTNGTLVNGQRLGDELVPLQDGQEIVLGSGVMVRYRISQAAPEESQSPPASATAPDASPLAAFQRPASPPPAEDAEEDPAPVPTPAPESEEVEAAYPPPTAVLEEDPLQALMADSPPSEPDPPPLAEPDQGRAHPLVAQENGGRGRRNTTLVVTVALIFLCLCAFALSAYFLWGDPLMRALGVY
jgi:pSer/pThr/pTyr-binding forkhead associated (FHA) protein